MATIKDTKKYRITKLNNDNTVTVLHPETESSLVKFPSTATGAKVLVSATKASNEVNGVVESSVTSTELGYLSGVTSAIQTQINGKEPTISLTASKAVVSNGSGKLAVSDTTSTELGYVHGVTSAIQTQLDGKVGYSAVSTTASHGVALTKTSSSFGLTVTPGSVASGDTGVVTGDAVNTAIANAIAGVHQFDYVISTDAATTPEGVQWKSGSTTITGTLAAAAATQYKIYLVPVDDALSGTYAEYITVKPNANYAWEKIGTTAVDLSDYTTTAKLTGFTTSGRNFKLNADANGNIYVTVPSDNSDTWRNIKVNGDQVLGTGITTGSLDFATGTTNGTISVAGTEVAVKGLDTAAYAKTGGSVASGDTKLVSGGTVYTALQDYAPNGTIANGDTKAVSGDTVYDYLTANYAEKQNITSGTYSAVQVNTAGQVTDGGQIVAYGTTANSLDVPADLAVGGLFFELLA